jgi:hypothetical protein
MSASKNKSRRTIFPIEPMRLYVSCISHTAEQTRQPTTLAKQYGASRRHRSHRYRMTSVEDVLLNGVRAVVM